MIGRFRQFGKTLSRAFPTAAPRALREPHDPAAPSATRLEARPSADDQRQPASDAPALTDAVRFRDCGERVGSLYGKPKALGGDQRADLGQRVKGVALSAATEARPVPFRAAEAGERHDVVRAAGEIGLPDYGITGLRVEWTPKVRHRILW